jgi:hypothetical protein
MLKSNSSMIVTTIVQSLGNIVVASTVVGKSTLEQSFSPFLSPAAPRLPPVTPSKAPSVLLGIEATDDALVLSGKVLQLHA